MQIQQSNISHPVQGKGAMVESYGWGGGGGGSGSVFCWLSNCKQTSLPALMQCVKVEGDKGREK